MKIYPGNHKVFSTETIDKNRDIPLAYLDTDFLEETISIAVSDEMAISSVTEVLPYDLFKTTEVTLYDKYGDPLTKEEQSDLLVKQVAGNYIYTPKASLTFQPHTFNYKVLAKKNMKYLTSRKYNIKAACSDKELATQMIQFFSDSYERNLCPTNIRFNNGDKKLESLFNSSLSELDFIFINAQDGKTFDGESEIPINEYIDNNIVPWIICDKLPENEEEINYQDQDELEFEMLSSTVTSTKPFLTKYYFTTPSTVKHELSNSNQTADIEYHKLFKYHERKTPIIVKEIVDKGFVVYCSSSFMANLSELSDIFYEVLMYVFLRAYVSTQTINEWIADVMPNYIVQNGRLTQKEKFTSNMELHKLLGLRENDAIPIMVDIEEPKIAYYTGMASNYLVFKKIPKPETADPIKKENQISIFTSRKDIMFYDNFVYSIKEDITDKITAIIDGSKLRVTVKNFKNTELNTGEYQTETVQFEINNTLMNQEVILVWNKNLKSIELVNEMKDVHVLMATINIIKEKKDSKLYDMRQRGGGLPDDSKDVFDCLDIGNILGRPYRKGGTMITTIKLPKKYEAKKDMIYEVIYNTIRQHMVAEDYLVLNIEFKEVN